MDFSKLKYISTDAPTTDELELLNESRVRVAQVIRARWIILGILAAYEVVPYAIFQQREEELKKLVIKDNLTTLYNRAYFFYRLNSEIQRAKRYRRPLITAFSTIATFGGFLR